MQWLRVTFIITGLCFVQFASATTINVPADQPTIQSGINASIDGDTVLVAAGTYFENIIWPAVNGIKLIGSGENDCVIDGGQQSTVILFEEDLGGIIDASTEIAGFTIQNGSYNHGGGICCKYASPSFQNITITCNNAIYHGGGICFWHSNASLVNAVITNNSALNGGGVYVHYCSDVYIENVTITGNVASVAYDGGGISCSYCNAHATVVNCVFWNDSPQEVFAVKTIRTHLAI